MCSIKELNNCLMRDREFIGVVEWRLFQEVTMCMKLLWVRALLLCSSICYWKDFKTVEQAPLPVAVDRFYRFRSREC
ncbi:MAG: hypothetical protein NZ912_02185 [Ignisphaera sp.]|nr:hypothetical protein [Ignisphaera sp.]